MDCCLGSDGQALSCSFAIGWNDTVVLTSVNPLSNAGTCESMAERRPWHRSKANLVEQIRVRSAIIRIVEIDVEIGLEFEPGDVGVVAPGFQTVAHAEPPDRPVIDRIDGGELRKIDWEQLRGWFDTIEL